MSQNIQLSIIIPTWNTADITLKCVKTILNKLPNGTAEIIVVDNGSTDNTKNLFSKNKAIKYIQNSSNLGFSKGCNIGAKHSSGKYLFFLNSDMEFFNDKLSSMLKFYRQTKDCGIVGPQFLNPDLTIQGSVFPNQSLYNAIKQYWFGLNTFSKYYPDTDKPLSVWAISGGAILISRKLFNQLGGWDEKYFFYYEDLDLCRKIRNINKYIYYFPEFKLIHRHGASGQNITDSLNQWRRLIPSSKIYHGLFVHYLLFLITWIAQKWHKGYHAFQKHL